MTDKEIITKVEKEIEGLNDLDQETLKIAEKLIMRDGNLIILITAKVTSSFDEGRTILGLSGESIETN